MYTLKELKKGATGILKSEVGMAVLVLKMSFIGGVAGNGRRFDHFFG